MVKSVSDFKICKYILQELCKAKGKKFVDIEIVFGEVEKSSYKNSIFVEKSDNVILTNYKIICEYVKKSELIIGTNFFPNQKKKNLFFLYLASFLKKITGGVSKDIEVEKPFCRNLYQNSFIWVLFNDLILPLYNVKLDNIRTVYMNNPLSDICCLIDIDDKNDEEDVIIVNNIENQVVIDAFLFVELLRYLKLDVMSVVSEIYNNENIFHLFSGYLDLCLNVEEKKQFEYIIKVISGVKESVIKNAQYSSIGSGSNFWYLGVLEKMISPVRGNDWSTYRLLEPSVSEFWNKVEKKKEKRKKEKKDVGVPFDLLLRIKNESDGIDISYDEVIQGLLSENRVV